MAKQEPSPRGERSSVFYSKKMLIRYQTNKQNRFFPCCNNHSGCEEDKQAYFVLTSKKYVVHFDLLPLSLSFPLPLSLSSVVEDGGLSVGDGMVRDGRRCFGGIGGGGS